MSRVLALTVVFVIGTVASACGASVAPSALDEGDPQQAEVVRVQTDTATIGVGETVVFDQHGLAVTFVALVADSRCPIGVTCVWEGDAEVRVRAEIEGTEGTGTDLTLHTTLEPRTAVVGSKVLELVDVLPHPVYETPTDPALMSITVRVGDAPAG